MVNVACNSELEGIVKEVVRTSFEVVDFSYDNINNTNASFA